MRRLATSPIKSIQRGTTYISSGGTAETSIAPVNLDKSVINFSGFSAQGDNFYNSTAVYLNDASTVRAVRMSGGSTNVAIYWEVIEYA